MTEPHDSRKTKRSRLMTEGKKRKLFVMTDDDGGKGGA
jgi:hypothetical protein